MGMLNNRFILKKFLADTWLDSARARLLMLVMVGGFTSIGAYFGFQQIGIVSASTTIKIGSLGVLSWTESVPRNEDCDRGSTDRLLACYVSFVKGDITSVEAPIENVASLWRSLGKKYDLLNSRRGKVRMPIVYSIDFKEGLQIFTIVTRGTSKKDALGLLEKVSDTIVEAHRNRVQTHRAFLRSLEEQVESNDLEDDEASGSKKVKSAETLAMSAAIKSAAQSTYETIYVVKPRVLPRTMNDFWLRVISGCVIGLIMFGFLACLVKTSRN